MCAATMQDSTEVPQKFKNGTTMAPPPVKHPTLDFGSGHDLTVREIEPCMGLCADGVEPAWDSLPALPQLTQMFSLSQNKQTLKKKKWNYHMIRHLTSGYIYPKELTSGS